MTALENEMRMMPDILLGVQFPKMLIQVGINNKYHSRRRNVGSTCIDYLIVQHGVDCTSCHCVYSDAFASALVHPEAR